MAQRERARSTQQATRGNLIGAGVALAAFAAVSVLTGVFIHSERERNKLLAQYEAERIASGLFLIVAQAVSGAEVDTSLTGPIIRAATYDAGGRVEMIRIGDVPARLDPALLAPGEDHFEYDRARRSLTLFRRRWRPQDPRSGPDAPHRAGRRRSGGRNEFMLLEVDAAAYFRAEHRWLAAQIGSPFLIAGVVGGGTVLIRNNTRFRRRLDAQRQLVQLGEAARTLTHEIKNPLSAIRLKSAILRRTAGAVAVPELNVIDEEVDRLAALADRVSDFLRDPAGNVETIMLNDFLTELAQRHAGLRVDVPATPLAVRCDRERLRSAVENLVRNAEESGGDGAPVELTAAETGKSVTLCVLDRGSGIAPGQRHRVFDPFFTTKSKGSGIGLSITLRFIEAAGGSLELVARPGGGTEARVTLPQAEAAS